MEPHDGAYGGDDNESYQKDNFTIPINTFVAVNPNDSVSGHLFCECQGLKSAFAAEIFATFSFYLLNITCENFGIIAYLERKLQAISQQDVTRTVWIPIVKHQIENRK